MLTIDVKTRELWGLGLLPFLTACLQRGGLTGKYFALMSIFRLAVTFLTSRAIVHPHQFFQIFDLMWSIPFP